jgi:hypothetical protein
MVRSLIAFRRLGVPAAKVRVALVALSPLTAYSKETFLKVPVEDRLSVGLKSSESLEASP